MGYLKPPAVVMLQILLIPSTIFLPFLDFLILCHLKCSSTRFIYGVEFRGGSWLVVSFLQFTKYVRKGIIRHHKYWTGSRDPRNPRTMQDCTQNCCCMCRVCPVCQHGRVNPNRIPGLFLIAGIFFSICRWRQRSGFPCVSVLLMGGMVFAFCKHFQASVFQGHFNLALWLPTNV